jgi:hypothetical protein
MKANLRALSKVLLPLTDGEADALGALEWIEREQNLPESIRAFFMAKLERAVGVVLPAAEREALRNCADVSRFRAALGDHFEGRRKQRVAILAATGARWTPVAFVITQASEANAAALDVPERDRRLTDALTALRQLVLTGQLEARGDLEDWQHSEVRRTDADEAL